MFDKQAIPAGRKQKILPCLVGRQTLPMRSEPAENSRAHIGILLPSRLYCRLRNRTGSCLSARGLRDGKPHHRRSGISPCPEGCIAIIHYAHYTTFHSKTSSFGDPNPICCSPQQAGRKQKEKQAPVVSNSPIILAHALFTVRQILSLPSSRRRFSSSSRRPCPMSLGQRQCAPHLGAAAARGR